MKKLFILTLIIFTNQLVAQDKTLEERIAKLPDTEHSIFKQAIYANDLEMFQYAVDQAGDDLKKVKYSYNQTNINKGSTFLGMTPLMQAAASGNVEMVKILISKKVDLNATCKSTIYKYGINNSKGGNAKGLSAVYFAIQMGHKEVVQALIDAKANIALISLEISGADPISCTPRQWAKLYEQTEIEELIKNTKKW